MRLDGRVDFWDEETDLLDLRLFDLEGEDFEVRDRDSREVAGEAPSDTYELRFRC